MSTVLLFSFIVNLKFVYGDIMKDMTLMVDSDRLFVAEKSFESSMMWQQQYVIELLQKKKALEELGVTISEEFKLNLEKQKTYLDYLTQWCEAIRSERKKYM